MGQHRVEAEQQGTAERSGRPSRHARRGRSGRRRGWPGRGRSPPRRWCGSAAAASSGVQVLGAMAPVCHRARVAVRVLGPTWSRPCRRRIRRRCAARGMRSMGPMRFDTQLAGLEDAPEHARRLEALGVDGAFTFEGPHDVFTPLILAAGATSTLELATNVAIAFPRNPVQLAHQAWDLQLLSQGRFTLGLGSQIRAQVEKRYGAEFDRPDRPDARAGRRPAGHLRHLGDRRAARLPGRVHLPHPDAADVQPRPPPLRAPADRPRRARAPDGVPGRRGGRRSARHAVQHGAHFRTRTLPAVAEGLARGGRTACATSP